MKSESYPNVIGIGMYFTAKNWGGGGTRGWNLNHELSYQRKSWSKNRVEILTTSISGCS